MVRKNPHIGSHFDSWLDEEGIREEVTAAAIKAVIACQIARNEEENHQAADGAIDENQPIGGETLTHYGAISVTATGPSTAASATI
jgi:hypothetical protein